VKSKQFCSVCKQWLDMEIVPTGDGEDDDGVVWFRCPQCQGFLPKLSSQLETSTENAKEETGADPPAVAEPASAASPDTAEDMPWDSPADMMAARADDLVAVEEKPVAVPPGSPAPDPSAEAPTKVARPDPPGPPAEPAEPLAEYAALLEEKDSSTAVPYRPWDTYEVGQCVHHLAWDDCGVVVAKEDLPGGRHVIKCYFAEAGVVRLIEEAPQ